MADKIKLGPIKPIWLTYQNLTWFARHDTSINQIKKTSKQLGDEKHKLDKTEGEGPVSDKLPPADDVKGILVDTHMSCINIQYADANKKLHEISMDLPNAMYLLSLLKSVQLNLDIPFPDDPRDPSSPALRPSQR